MNEFKRYRTFCMEFGLIPDRVSSLKAYYERLKFWDELVREDLKLVRNLAKGSK